MLLAKSTTAEWQFKFHSGRNGRFTIDLVMYKARSCQNVDALQLYELSLQPLAAALQLNVAAIRRYIDALQLIRASLQLRASALQLRISTIAA
jgi:hypothetical protein